MMVYRYQEYKDGLHNFDDLHIFSLAVLQLIRALVKVVHLLLSKVSRTIGTGDSYDYNTGLIKKTVLRLQFECGLDSQTYSTLIGN